MNKLLAISAGIMLAGGAAQAAVITWGSVVNLSSASDVSTNGVLVQAVNACGAACLTSPLINGVQFVASSTLMTSDACGAFYSGNTGDTGYNALLNTLDYGSSSFTVGGGLLETGKQYLIQIWYVDQRSGTAGNRSMSFGDGNGNYSGWVDDKYVTGTFTANSGTQLIAVQGTNNAGGTATTHVTAYQIRDLSSPIPTLSTTATNPVAGAFTVTVSFSESVTGLTASDFVVGNGTASGVTGSGASWSVLITPAGNGDVSVTLPANTVLDVQSHGNVASGTLVRTYVAPTSDQPVPVLSTATNKVYGSYTVQINFSEPVTGLTLSDFVIAGGTLSSLSGSGSNYTVVVNPNFGGNVTLSLPANSVTDTDGDNLQNLPSNALVTSYHVNVAVSSLAQLKTYLPQNNVNCVMSPGTFTITAADVSGGQYTNSTLILGRNNKALLLFSGNNSTYDFTGVTLRVESGVWQQGYGNNGVYQIQTTGNSNVLKNLTMRDIGTVTNYPVDGCVNIVMDGAYNRIEGFDLMIMGSWPYGYGDCFGKGGSYTIKHYKHSAFLIRGESNHAKNCTLLHRSYGHAMFMQAASNPKIEGCYIQGEVRSTDDMLAETNGPAYAIGFLTDWGFTLPAGYMKSTGEGGIRAYNAGETVIDGVEYDRGTSNPTIINNTIVNMRTGVTLTHAAGTKYVSGCKTIGCERGYAIGSGTIENCVSDAQYGPAFGVDYETDSGVEADITIVPYLGEHHNGSRHFAYIYGSNHKLTFRGIEANPDATLQVDVGGKKRIESEIYATNIFKANNIVVNNFTGHPLILDTASTNITGQSIGAVANSGTANIITLKPWSITTNVTFYGKSTQSSLANDAPAFLAIDQNTSGIFGNGSVTHTANEAQPWWRIDLGKPYNISELRIWNRTDSNSSRLSNYDVTILNSSSQPVWTSYQASYPNPMISLNPGSVVGQHVMIQLRGTERLSLAELQIFGTPVHTAPDIQVSSSILTFAPIVSTNDLAQTQYLSSSATGGNEASEHAQLFNGLVGNTDADSNDPGEVQLGSGNAVTVTFNTSVNTNGYDLTGIKSYFGGSTSSGGRANQGYGIVLTYVDGSVATLVNPANWASNSPTAFYWTSVAFSEASGGVMASGVKAVTFNITADANAGGVVVAREIDIFGGPTVAPRHYKPEFVSDSTTVFNGNFITQFTGEPGEGYAVEWTPSLTSAWQTLTNISTLESSPFMISVPATNNAAYFRARWIPAGN